MQQKKNVQSPASRKGIDGLPTTKKKLTSLVVRRGQSQVRLEVELHPAQEMDDQDPSLQDAAWLRSGSIPVTAEAIIVKRSLLKSM